MIVLQAAKIYFLQDEYINYLQFQLAYYIACGIEQILRTFMDISLMLCKNKIRNEYLGSV